MITAVTTLFNNNGKPFPWFQQFHLNCLFLGFTWFILTVSRVKFDGLQISLIPCLTKLLKMVKQSKLCISTCKLCISTYDIRRICHFTGFTWNKIFIFLRVKWLMNFSLVFNIWEMWCVSLTLFYNTKTCFSYGHMNYAYCSSFYLNFWFSEEIFLNFSQSI